MMIAGTIRAKGPTAPPETGFPASAFAPFGVTQEHKPETTDFIAFVLPLFFICHFLPKDRMSSLQTT